ncbi:glycosyltransferase family 4 protein, partial [Actinoplanes sp. NPDC051633]|uniref:glycosyltransferase family 4 protein n=1 Tax=Actinoplanes sp. NPDC051633 TaxID=3155670 RepID=UPI003426117B
DELDPDIIHANDYRMVGVGARAKLRAAARGKDVKLVWDAHEFVPGMSERPENPRWLPAQVAHEREFAKYADAVVTVSPMLAEWLQRDHQLAELPTVVLNCPDVTEAPEPNDRLRKDCGIGPETPLLGYCGGINSVRGVDLIIEALPYLPDLHVALVSLHPNGNRSTVEPIEELAEKLGVADRIHLLPYVAPDDVVSYLSGADAAVSPLRHLPNHEIALSNKFFEYSQARLPLIVSDVKAMAEMVRSTGQGEVFVADDVQDYVRAVKQVFADPERYRAAYEKAGVLDQWNWATQAGHLEQVYSRLTPSPSSSRS